MGFMLESVYGMLTVSLRIYMLFELWRGIEDNLTLPWLHNKFSFFLTGLRKWFVSEYIVSKDLYLHMQEIDVEDLATSEGQLQLTKYDYSSSGHEKYNGTYHSSVCPCQSKK